MVYWMHLSRRSLGRAVPFFGFMSLFILPLLLWYKPNFSLPKPIFDNKSLDPRWLEISFIIVGWGIPLIIVILGPALPYSVGEPIRQMLFLINNKQ